MTPTDHRPYIEAVAAALTTAGLPVDSITTETAPHRKAAVTIAPDSNDESIRLLWDEETNVWEYELSTDGWWDAKTRDWLPGGLATPPAVVVSELLYDSAYARHRLVAAVPEDLESALAAYATCKKDEPEPTTPRPRLDRRKLAAISATIAKVFAHQGWHWTLPGRPGFYRPDAADIALEIQGRLGDLKPGGSISSGRIAVDWEGDEHPENQEICIRLELGSIAADAPAEEAR